MRLPVEEKRKLDRMRKIFNILASLLFTIAAISLVGGYFIMKMWLDPDNDYLFMLYIFVGVFVLIVVTSQILEAVIWCMGSSHVKKLKAAAALENSSTGHGAVSYFPQPHYPPATHIASAKNYSTSESGAVGGARDRAGYAPIRDPKGRRLPARGGSYPYAAPPSGIARHDQFYR